MLDKHANTQVKSNFTSPGKIQFNKMKHFFCWLNRIIENPELYRTHKVHRVQLLPPHSTTQNQSLCSDLRNQSIKEVIICSSISPKLWQGLFLKTVPLVPWQFMMWKFCPLRCILGLFLTSEQWYLCTDFCFSDTFHVSSQGQFSREIPSKISALDYRVNNSPL